MSQPVIDASVVAAALFQEAHAEPASALLTGGDTLHAPDLLHAEVANVIWKRYGRGEITAEEAHELATDMLSLPLWIAPSAPLVESALELALRTGRTAYDCMYVALAVQQDAIMFTADQRLVNALDGGPLGPHVRWIGDQA